MKAKDEIKRDFRALGHLVTMGSGVVFSSILPVGGNGEGRNKENQQIDDTWWQQLVYTCLKQRKRSLHKGAVLIERALNWIEGEKD